jgi:hypothetical protein
MDLDHVPGREGDVHEEADAALEVFLLSHASHNIRYLEKDDIQA